MNLDLKVNANFGTLVLLVMIGVLCAFIHFEGSRYDRTSDAIDDLNGAIGIVGEKLDKIDTRLGKGHGSTQP